VQTYEYGYHRNFRTLHQRNATLHVGMYAPIPSHPDCNTHTQSGWLNTLDDTQLQIFNDLQEKFQDIWRAVKVIVAACKNGWGRAHNADGMDAAV
jgi:hypothetical protein